MGRKSVHVVPHGDRWAVKEAGGTKPASTHQTQKRAIDTAVHIARRNAEVVIHGRDGRIRDKDSYGPDPNPPKDKKH